MSGYLWVWAEYTCVSCRLQVLSEKMYARVILLSMNDTQSREAPNVTPYDTIWVIAMALQRFFGFTGCRVKKHGGIFFNGAIILNYVTIMAICLWFVKLTNGGNHGLVTCLGHHPRPQRMEVSWRSRWTVFHKGAMGSGAVGENQGEIPKSHGEWFGYDMVNGLSMVHWLLNPMVNDLVNGCYWVMNG